jgi:hypothetical protein
MAREPHGMAFFSLPGLKATFDAVLRLGPARTAIPRGFQPGDRSVCHSHSIVAGGLPEMS